MSRDGGLSGAVKRRLPVVPTNAGDGPLPARYARWMDALLGAPIPAEPHATCSDCAMISGDHGAESFDPSTRCCTYQPTLANFLVGALLLDRPSSKAARFGQRTLRARIRDGASVTPLGVAQSERFRLTYEAATPGDAFGQARSMRCPHYFEDEGLCGLWRHRESTCATWFCKHARGAVSFAFWRALQDLLTACERALARHAVLALDVGPKALAALLTHEGPHAAGARLDAAQVDERRDAERHRALWGRWATREEAFYIESARLVEPLGWADVARLGGVEVEARARVVKDAFAALTDAALPARLRVGWYGVAAIHGDAARVVTYSRLDPLELPLALLPALSCFDGRPVRQALAAIQRRHGVALDDDVLRQLVDAELLVPADD